MTSIFGLSSREDEPYLTQVFSFVLESDKRFCNFLIKDVFELPLAGEIKKIIPEASSESGRPDITLECENARIAIENKIGADFTDKQIERYKKEFEYVFLIYKLLNDPEQAGFATKSFTWYDIYSIMKKYIQNLSYSYDAINKYLLNQFIYFLEETNMGIEKVSWEILNGTKSLLNLTAEISEALTRLKGKQEILNYKWASSTAWYTGFQVLLGNNDSFNIYVYYNPLLVFTCFDDEEDWSPKFKRLIEVHSEVNWGRTYWHLDTLDISKNHFLCLSVDEQINTIVEFLERTKQKYNNV